MATTASAPRARRSATRSRAPDIDRHLGARLRERRLMLGLTQQQLAERVGVTYQQVHKYERGANRLAAAQLQALARALAVEVGYFFAGLEGGGGARPTPQQRLLLELAKSFAALPSRRHQEALCQLARAMAAEAAGGGGEDGQPA